MMSVSLDLLLHPPVVAHENGFPNVDMNVKNRKKWHDAVLSPSSGAEYQYNGRICVHLDARCSVGPIT